MSKTDTVKALERVKGHFKLYAKTCREAAAESKPRTKAAIDWAARAEVWHGAALELEHTIATITATPIKRKAKAVKA